MSLNTEEKIGLSAGLVFAALAIGAGLLSTKLLPSLNSKPAAVASASAATEQFVLGDLHMVLADGKVTITGRVADEASKNRILKPARLLWGPDHIVDQITVDATAPAFWWAARPIEIFARLKQLSAFDLKLADTGIHFSGVAGNAKLAEGIKLGASNWFKPGSAVTGNVTVTDDAQLAVWNDGVLLNESIEFATGSADVSANSHERLKEIATFLVEDGRVVRIVGHTDNTGDAAANKTLSLQRAESVRMILIQNGVKGTQLIAVGMGQEQPIADNNTETGRQKNRRIELAN
ncbi:OmpA family protein [Chitinibacter bivalviorum]|uniref:OmpA family protein n=1 Tax=Chitinibacter bivalviorum TaxID=2739434 RepID=A0A7H9BMS7_9NEIS|nr:OmpA family protein [Chitinibacter bivalviorum]QLG89391.1 OmpA family protein [Chitinibacter bivalviorum]